MARWAGGDSNGAAGDALGVDVAEEAFDHGFD